jgi:hypothetical protein
MTDIEIEEMLHMSLDHLVKVVHDKRVLRAILTLAIQCGIQKGQQQSLDIYHKMFTRPAS